MIRRAVEELDRRRTLLLLGSGYLRDAPFDELARTFERVVLIDAVHPLAARRRARRYRNSELVTRDLTGAVDWMMGAASERVDPLREWRDAQVDLVISANLLSQLPIRPEEWLEKHSERARELPADFLAQIVRWHLEDLQKFSGRVCLLTDVEMAEHARDGSVVDRLDLMRGVALPPPDESWSWMVAPFGELERDRCYIHRVCGYVDFVAAQARAPINPERRIDA
ncbi:hypothetical protein [Terrarubrum flagellatum]|uniref:hypothetical protein n=1 Tax=Terrirubrum flagellatum TaxID=2895980 RepID=UPI0031455223